MMHHGCFSRRLIDAIKSRTGVHYASGSIDVYQSVASLADLEEFLFIEHPFSMLAMGPHSGGFGVSAASNATTDAAFTALLADNAADEIRDPIEGRLPALEMYTLIAIEQAKTFAFASGLEVDYAAHTRRILDALDRRGSEERDRGIGLMREFLAKRGLVECIALVEDASARLPTEAISTQEPRRLLFPWYVSPGKVVLDLKKGGFGSVSSATAVLDSLIGDYSSDWLGVVRRAIVAGTRLAVGHPAALPDWTNVPLAQGWQ
jgi:hypothetical protein